MSLLEPLYLASTWLAVLEFCLNPTFFRMFLYFFLLPLQGIVIYMDFVKIYMGGKTT